ncbi:MAG: SGNH/GDSL hydrolase family protein [Candidatus Sumerlaeota bacterium]
MTALPTAKPIRTEDNLAWYRGEDLWVEGRAWNDTKTFWNRLPARAEGKVTSAVWGLQSNTAGMAVRFASNSKVVKALWNAGGGMNHMAPTGMSGLDLYKRGPGGEWLWAGTGRPNEKETTSELCKNDSGAKAEYLLFLPLYNNITRLEIGLDQDATVELPAKMSGPPVVFYGTSITQGGCASRAGMAHPAIVRRWLDREVVNLGFSGSGKMEPEMEQLLAELEASVYVLDCLPNMTEEQLDERLEVFVRDLRKARPDTPILLVSHIKESMAGDRNKKLMVIRDTLRAEGMKKIYFLDGPSTIAGGEEGTVDGIHPTDLGFDRMAKAFTPALRAMLNGDASQMDWPKQKEVKN